MRIVTDTALQFPDPCDDRSGSSVTNATSINDSSALTSR